MHIILGALGTLVTLLILINRLRENGIDIGWLNPFLWKRRRAWAKKYQGDPIFKISHPMELTALLMVAIAKAGGDITSEQKAALKQSFEKDFHLDEQQANELLLSSVHLLQDGDAVNNQLSLVMKTALPQFSEPQLESAVELINTVYAVETNPSQLQLDLKQRIQNNFSRQAKKQLKRKWA